MHSGREEAYLGLGGNLGDVEASMVTALGALCRRRAIEIAACSSIYRTQPVGGPSGQPDYLNAVVRVATPLTPRGLLEACLAVEQDMGRVRTVPWGPRTIDIDILLWGVRQVAEEGLAVPHPHLRERLFALVPLCEIAPGDTRLPPDGELLVAVRNRALAEQNVTLAEFNGRIVAKASRLCEAVPELFG